MCVPGGCVFLLLFTNLIFMIYQFDMLGESLQIVRQNMEIFIKASKGIGLEINSEKTKYV